MSTREYIEKWPRRHMSLAVETGLYIRANDETRRQLQAVTDAHTILTNVVLNDFKPYEGINLWKMRKEFIAFRKANRIADYLFSRGLEILTPGVPR